MEKYQLPPELISLVHHIELNKAGWWNKSIQQLIFVTIWLANENLTLNNIITNLKKEFNVSVSPAQLRSQLKKLCSDGKLLPVEGGKYKIAEDTIQEFELALVETESIESHVKQEFKIHLKTYCPTLDFIEVWRHFHEHFLIPFFRGNGAKIYELITGVEDGADIDSFFPDFLEQYPKNLHTMLRLVVNNFLDPLNPKVRSYILRYLNAYFFLISTNVRKETLQALEHAISVLPAFIIFVDTNCLFAILALDETPSNEAALRLIDLLNKMPTEIDMRLYVTQSTMDETRRVLISRLSDLKYIHFKPNLAQAAINLDVDGITRTFLEEYRKAPSSVEAESYFNPYINNLINICRSKNVELYNEKIDQYGTDQRVIDDICDQQEYEKEYYGKHAKGYKRLEHDIVLWHFVHDKRSVEVESPLQAKYWIVTADKRFLKFDVYKGYQLKDKIPVCLHPTTLVQMLQFWIPRTPEFEEAILSSIRLPFLVQKFDLAAERVALKILQVMSRFENIGDLPKDTITTILLNDALRQKISAETDVGKQSKLVKEVLIEENKKIGSAYKDITNRVTQLEQEVVDKKEKIAALKDQVEKQKRENEFIREKKVEEEKKRQKLEERFVSLGEKWDSEEKERNSERVRRQRKTAIILLILVIFIFICLELAVCLLSSVYGKGDNLLQRLVNSWPVLTLPVFVSIVAGYIILGKKRLYLLGWPWNKLFKMDV